MSPVIANTPVVVGRAVANEESQNITGNAPIRGVPLATGRRLGAVRQASARLLDPAENSWQMRAGRFIVNATFGLFLPAYALFLYQRFGDLPCDKPIGPWLQTYGTVGVTIGVLGLWVNLRMLALEPIMRRAMNLEEGEERQQALAPALAQLSMTTCISCCCIGPLGVFSIAWWVKGNFDVFGTAANAAISWDDPISSFHGCSPALLDSTRVLFFITYIMLVCSVCSLCAFCCVALTAIADGVDDDEFQDRVAEIAARGRAAMV